VIKLFHGQKGMALKGDGLGFRLGGAWPWIQAWRGMALEGDGGRWPWKGMALWIVEVWAGEWQRPVEGRRAIFQGMVQMQM